MTGTIVVAEERPRTPKARYHDAFDGPLLSDWRNFEIWQEPDSPAATDKANGLWKEMLAAYEPPPIDAAVVKAPDAYVAKRKGDDGFKTI